MLHRSGDYTEETIREEALCHCATFEPQIVIYTLEEKKYIIWKLLAFLAFSNKTL